MTILSARDFNQQVAKACKAALTEPVFITERGKPRHVLLSIETYEALTGQQKSIAELIALAEPAEAESDFEPVLSESHARAAEF